jgi:hypothetical protein
MLKRTITLLGLTITVGALLLTLGCGGSNNPVSTDSVTLESLLGVSGTMSSPTRGRGDAQVSLNLSSPVQINVKDSDGITSIGVVWLFPDGRWGRQYYFPGGQTEFSFPLPYFGQADYAFTIGTRIGLDSWYSVTRDGQLVRRWP